MQRQSSNDRSRDRQPNLATEERDTLLSRSVTPDLEAAGSSSRSGTGSGNGRSFLPNFTTRGSNGKKRRNSNDHVLFDPRRGNGGERLSTSRIERDQQRRLCILVTVLIFPLTFILLLMTHTFHIPWIHDRSSDLPPSTDPPGKGGDGPQHVPIPIGGLPPPTNVPRNDAFWTQGEGGIVASEDETCSRMGVDILKAGGNAVVSQNPHVSVYLPPPQTTC
jgi:hypothetical protein